jgi:tRNA-splicing endonuclease subunit Sen2
MTGKQDSSLEAATARTRKQRAAFKTERLKKEREEREKQRQEEAKEGGLVEVAKEGPAVGQKPNSTDIEDDSQQPTRKRRKTDNDIVESELPVYTEDYLYKEILQLTPEDAVFLMSLDLLTVHHSNKPLTLTEFLHLIIPTSRPDEPFLVRYIAYYHFRRQQLIVKTGLKFGVDYLIYHAPIPFVHAAHCVNVVGDYHLWEGGERLMRETVSCQEINLWQRLVGNVRKKMKVVYVEIPPAQDGDWRDGVKDKGDLERVLLRYRIREVLNSRVVMARERDKPSK